VKRKAIQKLIEFDDFSDNDFEDYDDGEGGQAKRRRRPMRDSEDEDENNVSREEEQRELKKAREMDEMEFHGNIFRDSFRKALKDEDGGSLQSRDRPRSSEMRRTRDKPERADEAVFEDDYE
jgi:hypothetical protein